MTRPLVTFAMVPGSFAKPQMYDKCEALLLAKGHNTILIDLLTANDGSRIPPATMTDDINHIRDRLVLVLDGPDPSDVVLAVHSYAGLPGTAAIKDLNKATRVNDGKPTGVIGILYIAAHIPEVGESVRSIMIDNFPDLFPEPFRTGWPGQYMPAIPPEMAPAVFSDLEDQSEIPKYAAMMLRHANDAYDGVCDFAGWSYDDVRCTLVLPGNDQTIPVVVQDFMVKRRGSKINVRRVDGASHCVNVSRPEIVVQEMLKLV